MTYVAEVLADNPVLFWKLNESVGTSITDYSGNAFHGTATGSGVTYGVGGIFDNEPALEFDGTGSITKAHEAALALTGAYTLEYWFRPTNTAITTHYHLLNKCSNLATAGGYYTFLLNLTNSYEHTHQMSNGVTGTGYALEEGLVLPGHWYHVAIVADGATNYLHYLDGALLRTAPGHATAASADDLTLCKTMSPAGTAIPGFVGRVAGVALYDDALSAARIAAHFAAGEKAVRHGGAFAGATVPRLATAAGQHKVYLAGNSEAVYTAQTGWWLPGFDDSAWSAPVAMTRSQFLSFSFTYGFQGAWPDGSEWVAATNNTNLTSGRVELYRLRLTLGGVPGAATLKYATDNKGWLVVNGVQVDSGIETFSDLDQTAPGSRNLDPSLFAAGDNVLAYYVRNGQINVTGGAHGPTGLALALLLPNKQRSSARLIS